MIYLRSNKRLTCVLKFIVLPLFVYALTRTGYCQSWWGSEILIFRSLWLCGCGADFEQTLYPDNVEVMFSACQNVTVHEVGSGTHLYVEGDAQYTDVGAYLLDMVTGEKTPFTAALEPNDSYQFLTDSLLLVYKSRHPDNPHPGYILEWQTGRKAEYTTFTTKELPVPINLDGSVNPDMVAFFQPADRIFYFFSDGPAITLVENWQERPDENLFISGAKFSEPEIGYGWLLEVLEVSGKPYSNVSSKGYHIGHSSSFPSHNGRFIADQSGVYDADTDEQIIDIRHLSERHSFRCRIFKGSSCVPAYVPCCWLANDTVVLYIYRPHTSLPEDLYELLDPPTMRGQVGAPFQVSPLSMPVLKVTIPESYR